MILCHYRKIVVLLLLCIDVATGYAQVPKNCPAFPSTNHFDTTCYMYLDEIQFGQGRVRNPSLWGDYPRDLYVPVNRPEWAIASVHGWQLMRNILKTEYYDKHVFFATALKESFWNCDAGISFAGLGLTYDITTNSNGNWSGAYQNDGCFHIAPSGYSWLKDYYPWRHSDAVHGTFISGDNFIRGAISKVHYDLLLVRFKEYSKGLDPLTVLNNAADPFAADIWNAKAYNKGYNAADIEAVMELPNRAASMANADWRTNMSLGYDYTEAISHVVKVLSNSYTGPLPDNQWDSWYDGQITWATMDNYMDQVIVMYPELSAAEITAIKNRVQAVFNTQDTDTDGAVSFRFEFGPVLDEFIIAMPYDDPMPAILNSVNGDAGCSGCIGPAVDVWPNGPTVVCEGLYVELETVAGSGYTYQWTKDGVDIPNPNPEQYILHATESGTYNVKVSNASGCEIEACCPQDVVILTGCSSCSMTVNLTPTSNSCTGIPDGQITSSVSGVTGPFDYSWTGPVTGNSSTLSNATDGTYILEVTQQSDNSCVGFAQIELTENTEIYQSLTLDSTRVNCDEYDLSAAIIDNPPTNCEYRVSVDYNNTANCYGTWPSWDWALKFEQNGVEVPIADPRSSGSGDCNHLDETFTVDDGASIEFLVHKIQDWASNPNFSVTVYAPDGSTVLTHNMTSQSFPNVADSYPIQSFTASCVQPTPSYNFSWTPGSVISNVNTGSNSSTADANLSSTTDVTVEATSPSVPGCILTQTLTLPNTCAGSCTDPGTASLSPSSPAAQCEGSITLTASETGSGSFEYEFFRNGVSVQGPGSTNTYPATQSGDYTVEITDPSDPGTCSSTSGVVTVTIDQNPTVSATSDDADNIICAGDNITLTGTGTALAYSWDGGVTDGNPFSPASTMTYTVTGTSGTCSVTDQTTVTVTPLPSGSGSISPTAAVCEGTTETYTISGISDATSYTWSADNGVTTTGSTSTSEDITAGSTDFTITVTPENSCGTSTPITQNITVNGNTGAAGSITGTTSICDNQSNEGFSIASVTNATSYTWTVTGDGSITSGQGTTNITVDFGTMSSYTIEVTPSGLCGDGTPSQLVVNNTGSVAAAISISQNPDPVCSGSDADIVANVTGGGATPTIEWWVDGVLEAANNNTTYTLSSPTGTESVEAILTNSSLACATGIPVTSNTLGVNVEAQPTADITDPSGTSKTINTTSTTLTAAGIGAGESGMWSKPNAGEQGNLVAPLNTTTVTLQDLNSFESGIGDGTTEICWTVSTATGACPDAQECVNVIRQDVSVPNVRPYSDTICESNLPHANIPGDPAPNTGAGETGTWSGVGGAPFTQVGDDLQPDIITSGVYQYVYTIENSGLGVTNRDTVTLQVDASPGTADAGSNQSICATNYTLTGTTPTTGTGLWTGSGVTFDDASSPTATVSGLSTGVNTLTWTVSNGVCPADVSTVDITVSGSVTSPDAGTYPSLCETQTSLSLNANSPGSGETGTWSVSGPGTITDVNNPNATLTITGPGTIDITWTISNGVCSPDPFNSTSITVESAPDVAVAGSDSTICGDNITLYANTPSPGTGMWTQTGGSGTGTITSPTSPTSTVTGISGTIILEWEVTNGSACSSNTDQVEITSTGIVTPTVDITVDNNPYCLGTPVTFTATGTYPGSTPTYDWYVDGVLQQSSSSNTYSNGVLFTGQQVHVELQSSLACATSSTAVSTAITMTASNPTNPIIVEGDQHFCSDETRVLTAQAVGTVTWYKDGVAQTQGTSITIGSGDEGQWTIEDDNGVCPPSTSPSVAVSIDNVPTVSAGPDLTIEFGESTTLQGSTNASSISWDPAGDLSDATAQQPTVTPTTAGSIDYTITATEGVCQVEDVMTLTVYLPVTVPNVFTPNGDGDNDSWQIPGVTTYPEAVLTVFNRWGMPVYKSVGNIEPWDGTKEGQQMPVATYYYILDLNNGTEPMTGSVSLIR